MAVIIKGMEMPKGCGVCPFRDDECFGAWKCWHVKDWGDDDNRAKGCPLFPLPSGCGRLIDADALCRFIANNSRIDGVIAAGIISYINAAPTIVPAKGGEGDA